MGRKYSLGKYGDNSYDLIREQGPWLPIPDPPPVEIWMSALSDSPEIWVPIPPVPGTLEHG